MLALQQPRAFAHTRKIGGFAEAHRVPLELTVASVDRLTATRMTCTFSDLIEGAETTDQLVSTFLAILELAKRGSITLTQEENFGEIVIERVPGAPEYHPGEALAVEE